MKQNSEQSESQQHDFLEAMEELLGKTVIITSIGDVYCDGVLCHPSLASDSCTVCTDCPLISVLTELEQSKPSAKMVPWRSESGGTIVPPSDFQSDSTKNPFNKSNSI